VARKAAKTPSVQPAVEKKTSRKSKSPTSETPLAAKLDQAHEEQIRLLAFLKWEAAGKPDGDGSIHWLEAEQEVKQAPK
jgi:hypothetical protein